MPSGYYITDLGRSLDEFSKNFLDKLDSRTIFIVIGVGRNNYKDLHLSLFEKLSRRSWRTIWLTPETSFLWGRGDSDMLKYAPRCDVILQAGTLAELTRAVDKRLDTEGC